MNKIKPDFTKAWEIGCEYVMQEGSGVWQKIREEAGYTREELYEALDYMALHPARQQLLEEIVDWPEWEELEWYARIADMTPGQLIDYIYITKGEEILKDEW